MRNGSEMMEKDIFFTPEGLEKIENEIEFLKTVRRKEVAEYQYSSESGLCSDAGVLW